MVKSVIVTLTVDIPETELSKDAKIVIETVEYVGRITAIIVHEAQVPTSKLTIEAQGLKVSTS